MTRFAAATARLAPYVPEALVTPLAWSVTVLEIVLGVALALGLQTRRAGIVSAILLASFALSMVVVLGPKFPLNYSVFTASACALLRTRTQEA
jgi:uncharacterized membrane protein YphA (DoxX/SURF4 family)